MRIGVQPFRKSRVQDASPLGIDAGEFDPKRIFKDDICKNNTKNIQVAEELAARLGHKKYFSNFLNRSKFFRNIEGFVDNDADAQGLFDALKTGIVYRVETSKDHTYIYSLKIDPVAMINNDQIYKIRFNYKDIIF